MWRQSCRLLFVSKFKSTRSQSIDSLLFVFVETNMQCKSTGIYQNYYVGFGCKSMTTSISWNALLMVRSIFHVTSSVFSGWMKRIMSIFIYHGNEHNAIDSSRQYRSSLLCLQNSVHSKFHISIILFDSIGSN